VPLAVDVRRRRTSLSKNLRDFTKAVYGFDHVMRGVQVTMWDNATPCEEWSARDVAGHVTGVIEMVGAQARGRAPAYDFMRDPGAIVGDDPYRSWYEVKEATLEALDQLGALERLARTPRGRQPVDELIGDTVVDSIVHTWDLARGVNGDERLDEGLVLRGIGIIEPLTPMLSSTPYYKEPQSTRPTASAQDKLLALTGRNPHRDGS